MTHVTSNLPIESFYGRCLTDSGQRLNVCDNISSEITLDIDEIDNRTNESVDLAHLKTNSIYRMNDIYHREDERLKTFSRWPLEWMNKIHLAQTGMFYTGEDDKVKCYFCEVEIGRWERNDEPVSEHLRWSPNCPLLRRRTTNNIPIDSEALNSILPAISYDICGANEALILPPTTSSEGNTPYFPDYPEYAVESARLRSFADWPRNMKQKPHQLSEAGFFYTGVGDRVKCFSCGGGLKDWDDDDEPWEQHALWLNKCRFLKLIKGQSFIDLVVAKQKSKHDDAENTDLSEEAFVSDENSRALLKASTASNSSLKSPTKLLLSADNISSNNETLVCERKSACASNIPEEKLCKICYVGEYNTAFLPCGHVVACAKCASSVTKCPLCRKTFSDVMRVYFS